LWNYSFVQVFKIIS